MGLKQSKLMINDCNRMRFDSRIRLARRNMRLMRLGLVGSIYIYRDLMKAKPFSFKYIHQTAKGKRADNGK